MAAIGKIREQSTLLLIVIGGAMVAFVLGDIFSGGSGSPSDQYVGQVYGEEINLRDYESRVEAQKQSMASVGQPVSTSAEQQIRNQVWNTMIQERIMYAELNKLGMRVSQDEFDDIRFGENIRSEFASDENFQNQETGQFDPQLVQNYFSFLNQQYPLFYQNQVNRIVNERLYEKYNNMVKKGLYVNTLEGKDAYYAQERKVQMNFVVRSFDSVADSTIQVSDNDLKAYFEKHKDEDRFDRTAQADISYVVFEVSPSEDDEKEIQEELADLKNEFTRSKNDSLFVLKFSSSRNANPVQLNTKDNPELDALIATAEEGDVIGPYKADGRYAIAKVQKVGSEEQATARHILLSSQTGADKENLKQRADSMKKVIASKNNFEEMVALFSEDPGSQATGGKYEWFNRETMVAPFTEASFDRPIGSLNVVETDYGVHLVEPLERRNGRVVTVWEVDTRIEPSNESFNRAYDEANEFSIEASDAEGMIKLASDRGYEIKEAKAVKRDATSIPGVPGSTEVIRWAHDSKTSVSKVSEPFEFNNNIVIAVLNSRKVDGRATFEDVKEEIKPEVIKEKKAEQFKKEMDGKNLEQLATEFNLTNQLASNVSESRPTLPGAGNEPYIVGFALTLAEGALSPPLKGNRGVYVVNVISKTQVDPREEYLTYVDELQETRTGQVSTYTSGVYRALKEKANVKDDRSKIY